MAAAIGAGLPVAEATGSMVVDIGGGTSGGCGHLPGRYRQRLLLGPRWRATSSTQPIISICQKEIQPAHRRAHRGGRCEISRSGPRSPTEGTEDASDGDQGAQPGGRAPEKRHASSGEEVPGSAFRPAGSRLMDAIKSTLDNNAAGAVRRTSSTTALLLTGGGALSQGPGPV